MKDMCLFFGISRAAYYAWRVRSIRPDKNVERKELILEAYQASRSTYGYRRIGLWLSIHKGIKINHKAILRLMNQMGIHSVVRKRKPHTKFSQTCSHFYGNLLQRDFYAAGPNQKWSTDISFIPTKQGWAYLSVIKDLHDSFIVSFAIKQANSVDLVVQTLRNALANQKVTDGLILHSDQGHQYSSHAYYVLTHEYNISPSMSRRANCWDNAPVETFFGCLKEECIRQLPLLTFEEVKSTIADYIYFYNYERIQLKTRKTPFEVRRLSGLN